MYLIDLNDTARCSDCLFQVRQIRLAICSTTEVKITKYHNLVSEVIYNVLKNNILIFGLAIADTRHREFNDNLNRGYSASL